MAEKQPDYGKILAQWEVPEFEKYNRSILWYILSTVFGLFFFIHAIWTFNFLFAIIIIIIATIIVIHEKRTPDIIDFKIAQDGIILDDKFIAFKEINKFWLIYEPPETKKLYFNIQRTLRPELSISLANMNPIFVRKILLKYLPEDLYEQDISTNDQWSRILKI